LVFKLARFKVPRLRFHDSPGASLKKAMPEARSSRRPRLAGYKGHVRIRRKPIVGLKENQRINPLQSKFCPGRGCHTAG
jgi:hypothetical protein